MRPIVAGFSVALGYVVLMQKRRSSIAHVLPEGRALTVITPAAKVLLRIRLESRISVADGQVR